MPCPKLSMPYIVREGDTLSRIALTYQTSVNSILKANVNLNPYNLNVGQTICIPLPEEEYPSCQTTNYYIAQEGDTFFSIGKKFGVDTSEIINANIGVLPENIFTGIILCIPVAPSPVSLFVSHDGKSITLQNGFSNETKTYTSHLSSPASLLPGRLILTKKRLESGSVSGAKEILFSPYPFGIRGENAMRDSTGLFLETDNDSMLEIFNSAPVGSILEVEKS